jgi:antitoxin YefM
MDALSCRAARARKERTDRICQDRSSLSIMRRLGESLGAGSPVDYDGMVETLHLLASPRNAERLTHALEDVRAGRNTADRTLTSE